MAPAAPKKASFPSNAYTIVGELYQPTSSSSSGKYPAIVLSTPVTSVKEQSTAVYARYLADKGFICLTFDPAYQGESSGEPRLLENPYQRVEDIKSAVTYLSLQPEVDASKIGAVGICGSGGYVPFAAQTDVRIKAVAAISGVCVGRLTRTGILKPVDAKALETGLALAGNLRIEEAKTGKGQSAPILPENPEDIPDTQDFMWKDAARYYKTARGRHPRCASAWATRSVELMANYDSYNFNSLISPRPLLMIAGSEADTLRFSNEAVALAQEPKELFIIPGKTHAQLYDEVTDSGPKLAAFFSKELGV
ncbi:hypothetical protein DV737_g2921, partial [Chaetothyriales sp. CBS 132003]